jgi:hypothetical protein
MKPESKKFVDFVIEYSNDCPSILSGAINDSKYHFGQLASDDCNERKILLSYKKDLMLKWNFINDLVYEEKLNLKKVDFWEVMRFFAEYQ